MCLRVCWLIRIPQHMVPSRTPLHSFWQLRWLPGPWRARDGETEREKRERHRDENRVRVRLGNKMMGREEEITCKQRVRDHSGGRYLERDDMRGIREMKSDVSFSTTG